MDAKQVAALIRPDVFEMDPYTPIVPFEVLSAQLGLPADRIVKVDANENPYGPSPRVAAALAGYPYYHIYPDPNHTLLREALEGYVGVGREHLMLGTGSDELLDLVMRLFLQPGDHAVNCPPTFGMYPFLASVARAHVLSVLRRADFALDVAAIASLFARTERPPKLIFVASPNNPDGSVLSQADLLRLLALPAVVVVDQAYVEFGGTDFSPLVPVHANLIVMRTFSKWAGLAGLRVGYGVFPLAIVAQLFKIKQPYNVNAAAQAAVLASLEDLETLQARVRTLVAGRERLYAGLRAIDYLHPYPSQSNFILSRVRGRDADALKRALERRGILVRHYRTPGLQDCIRISVGTPEQNARVLAALEEEGAPRMGKYTMDGKEGRECRQAYGSVGEGGEGMRTACVERKTGETEVSVELDLDGSGHWQIETGIGFFDHMLSHVAVHGMIDLTLQARGDLHVDAHHTVEDVGIALGSALRQALGDRTGIVRYGQSLLPMDEALAMVALDFSNRGVFVGELPFSAPKVGEFDTELAVEFLRALACNAGMTLHVRLICGQNTHHQVEAVFKGLGRALRQAVALDERRAGAVPSTKGVL